MSYEYSYLEYKSSVSRGRDTYGCTIISLTDTKTGKRYRTCGGGYDMVGTVLAEWMGDRLQSELHAYLSKQGFKPGEYASGGEEARREGKTYGAGISKKGVAYMDGAVGSNSVCMVLEALGYKVRDAYKSTKTNRWAKFLGFRVEKNRC